MGVNYWDRTGTLVTPEIITDNISTLGSIGIGTTNPAAALNINNGNILLSDNYWLGLGTTAGRIEFDDQATDEINFLGANVGIGTSTPSALLSVGAGSEFTVNDSGAITAATGITSSGSITFSGLSTSGVVTVTSGVLGSEAQLDIARGGTNSTATPTAGGISYGTGTAYAFSSAGSTSYLLSSNGTGAPTWVDPDTVGINYWDRTGTLVTPEIITDNIATLGSIGIGNTNPAAALGVGATNQFQIDTNGLVNITAGTGSSINLTRSSAGQWMSFDDGTDSWGLYNYAGNPENNLYADTGALAMDTNTGTLYVKSSDASTTDWVNLATGATTLWTDAGGFIYADNATSISITDTGLVGIGTTGPTEALDIYNGNILLSDNYWLGLGTAAARIELDDQATDEINFLDANVGIGTSSPSALLSVGATSQFQVNTDGLASISAGTGAAISLTRSSAGQWISFNDGTDAWGLYNYAGNPENNVYADTGALAMDTNTGTLYVKSSDASTTDWVNLATGGSTTWTDAGDYLYADNSVNTAVADNGRLGIGTTLPAYMIDIVSSDTTGGLGVTADSVTTGTGALFSFDGLTSGTGFLIESDPGSSTTLSGDLLRLNVGSNVTVTGNILSIEDNGTDLFTISQSAITSALPHSFTAAGDVTVAYDLVLSNQTSSVIESYGPLTVRAGESFESNNLTLQTYNAGDVIIDLATDDTGTSQLLVNATTDDFMAEYFNDGNSDSYEGILVQACLDTNPTSSCNFMQFNDGNGTALGAIEGNGAGSITYSTSGADYAELFDGDRTQVEPGDILALGTDGNITKATPNTKIIGAYSSNPSSLGNWFDNWEEDTNVVPVGLVGQIKINVSNENGQIEKGDPIAISSETAGLGIKATTATRIVGFAMEATSTSLANGDTQKVKVYVSPAWYDPSLYVGTFGELAGNVQNVSLSVEDLNTRLGTLELTTEINDFASVEEAINNINSEVNNTKSEVELLRDEVAALTQLIDTSESSESTQASESTQSAQLSASGILEEIVSVFDEFKSFVASLGLSVNTDENGEEALTIASNLNVLGDSILADLTLTGDLQAGFVKVDSLQNSIGILGPSCYNSVTGIYNEELCGAQTLYLQKELAGNVDVFNGSIVLAANGDITIDGTLEAQKVVADEFAVKGASSLIGTSTLPAGQTTITIDSASVASTSKVFVTATNSTQGQQLYVSNKVEGTSFTVAIDNAVLSDINFDWWIVNIETE